MAHECEDVLINPKTSADATAVVKKLPELGSDASRGGD